MRLLSGLLCAGLVFVADAASAASRVYFNLPKGVAESSLMEFSRQSGLPVVLQNDTRLDSAVTNAVIGWASPREALVQLVKGSGVRYGFEKRHTIAFWYEPPTRSVATTAADEEPEVEIWGLRERRASLPQETPAFGGGLGLGESLQDVRRLPFRTQPQIFPGGPSEDTQADRESATNPARGAGINLRALGTAQSLIVLNGRRVAPSGSAGAFTDVLNISTAHLDNVEILAEGVTAAYGADTLGGVANLKTRTNLEGSETQVAFGSATEGRLRDKQVSHAFGRKWDDGGVVLSVEIFERASLRASEIPQVNSDLRPFGGDDFRSPASNPGTIFFGPMSWRIPGNQDGTSLTVADLIPGESNLSNLREGAEVLPSQQRHSVYAHVEQEIAEGLDIFAEAIFSERRVEQGLGGLRRTLILPPSNPHYIDPVGLSQPIVVAYDFFHDFGPVTMDAVVRTGNAALGANFTLRQNHRLAVSLSGAFEKQHQRSPWTLDELALQKALANSDPQFAFNPLSHGSHTNPETLDGLTREFHFRSRSQLDSVQFLLEGPLGSVNYAVGADFRRESLEAGFVGSGDRKVFGTYAQLRIPLMGRMDALSETATLETSMAARHERYSRFGGLIVPEFGVTWRPLSGLTLRGSVSRSARAPNLPEISDDNNISGVSVLQQGGASRLALVETGNNSELEMETGRNVTLGVLLAPASFANLSLALTYFDVRLRDRVHAATFSPNLLDDVQFAERVTRGPTPEEVAAVCARTDFTGGDCALVDVDALVDMRLRNGTLLRTRGFDFRSEYVWNTGIGRLDLGLSGTYLLDFLQADGHTAPLVNLLNTPRNLLRLRMLGSVGLSGAQWSATAYVSFANRYRDVYTPEERDVDALTTVNLRLAYDFGVDGNGLLAGTTIVLAVENVFDEDAPFLNDSGGGYDAVNSDLLRRMARVRLKKSW